MLAVGRELEDHRLKRPKLESALKKKMADLNSFATVRHLANLVDDRKGEVACIRQIVEECILQGAFDRIDELEANTTRADPEPNSVSAAHGSRWVPDDMAPCCAACLRPFQWWRRRHHCRMCGHVFCSAHSNTRVSLPDIPSAGQVRACDDCAKVTRAQQYVPSHSPVPPPHTHPHPRPSHSPSGPPKLWLSSVPAPVPSHPASVLRRADPRS